MAVRRKAATPATGVELFTEDHKAQINAAVRSLLEAHKPRVEKAINEAEDHTLVLNLKLTVDCSEGQPALDVKLSYTPETVTDRRVIKCSDPNQKEFEILSPAQMEQRAEEERTKAALEQAEKDAAAEDDDEGGDGEKPAGRGKRKK